MIALIVVIIVFAIVLAVLPLVWLAQYALQGFALWRMAKQTEACKPGYAWIPVVQSFVLGKCAEACETNEEGKGITWGKYLLIAKIVHLSCIVFGLPLGILLSFFGGGILLDVISLVAVVYTVLSLVCRYKIYHRYIGDPWDIIVTLLHMHYGMTNIGLLIVSFLKPRTSKIETYTAAFEQDEQVNEAEDGVVIEAEEE